jgi:hypothetical protein
MLNNQFYQYNSKHQVAELQYDGQQWIGMGGTDF